MHNYKGIPTHTQLFTYKPNTIRPTSKQPNVTSPKRRSYQTFQAKKCLVAKRPDKIFYLKK